MKKFVYKMQSVLNIKEKLEEQEKARYAAALAKLNEEEEKLSQLYDSGMRGAPAGVRGGKFECDGNTAQ